LSRDFRRRLCDVNGGLPAFSNPSLPGASVAWSRLAEVPEDPFLPDYVLRAQAVEIVDAGKVSLPSTPPSLRLLDVLPEADAQLYGSLEGLLRPREEVREMPRAHLISRPVMLDLLRRLQATGRVQWTQQPKAVNGVFGIQKPDGSVRLITDCRAANAHFIDSPPVQLPTPDVIASLEVPEGTTLYTAKADLSDFFHQFLLPDHLRPYFCLPSIRAGELGIPGYGPHEVVWPMLTTVPMGWSHAVYVTQRAHEEIVLREGLFARDDFISNAADARVSRPRIFIYIDDSGICGTSREEVAGLQQRYLAVMARYGLPAKPSKVVPATSTGVDVLGVRVDAARFGLGVDKLVTLAALTEAMLARGYATGRQFSRLIGSWVWCLLPCRPFLSVLRACYRFVAAAWQEPRPLWHSVRRELQVLLGLLPLLHVDLSAPWSGVLVAADSSSTGLGVVYAGVSPGQAGALAQQEAAAVQQLDRLRWATAVQYRWRSREHISLLELRAALCALKWVASRPSAFGRRVLLLSDSSSTVGALAKGRSPSFSLLMVLRRVAVVCAGFGIRFTPRWIPTGANPADGPSRAAG